MARRRFGRFAMFPAQVCVALALLPYAESVEPQPDP